MGSVLVNPSGSRSSMLRRDSESPCLGSRSLKSASSREREKFSASAAAFAPSPPPPSHATTASVSLNTEMLRELKRRVLVCLDNNAAAAEVARRLLSDRNADFTKLGAIGRRSCPDASSVRRKSSVESGGGGQSSPFEIVSECFEMLDRLLSDIAKKDAEIARLQKELAAAERLCRSYENRIGHLQQSCARFNGSTQLSLCNGASASAASDAWRLADAAHPSAPASTAAVPAKREDVTTTTTTTTAAAAAAAVSATASTRSPRKSRRSSVEMLSLPSIHDTAGGEGTQELLQARKRSAAEAAEASAKRMRLEVRCKEEPPEESEAKEVKEEAEEEVEEEEEEGSKRARMEPPEKKERVIRRGKKKRGRCPTVPAPAVTASTPAAIAPVPDAPAEERLAKQFGPFLTTAQAYYFGDFDSMLERRERERERRRASEETIHTPGWRLAPACGRTRAATLAAAAGSGSGEAAGSPADSEMPEEGCGFAEWAALSDDPFETRHRRHEQAEQKRDRAELRALRERQRTARQRQRQLYMGLPTAAGAALGADHLVTAADQLLHGPGKGEAFGGGGGGGGGGAGGSGGGGSCAGGADAEAAASTGPGRLGLPESLLPNGLEEGEMKDCCIYYYPKDKVPVVAFGRLLQARKKKSHGFALPWKKGR